MYISLDGGENKITSLFKFNDRALEYVKTPKETYFFL